MSIDITPLIAAGRQSIQGYGDGGFRIAGIRHEGSCIVFAERTLAWPVADVAGIGIEALRPATSVAEALDILIVGCGAAFGPEPDGLRRALKEYSIVLEWMDTGAACRTFNVLLAEERQAAAALIAVE